LRTLFFTIIVKPLLVFFIGMRVRGRDRLPKAHPFIMVANHASHLDTIALLSLFPPRDLCRVRPVAAADYFERNRVVSRVCHVLFNILSIERKSVSRDANPLDALRRAIQEGTSLIIFPEGTRSSSGEIRDFHSGVAHIIRDFPGVPVIPVYLSNMGRALPKGEVILLPFICEVNVGEPMFPAGSKEEIMTALRTAVGRLQGESMW
jgi:1-acyl-sn-glycerol-3-phosphate acyltransferase